MSKNLGDLQQTIEKAYEGALPLDADETRRAVESAIEALDRGELRVAEPISPGNWKTNEWAKKAILLYFRSRKIAPMAAGDLSFVDKLPPKRWTGVEGVRVVPPAVVRKGAYVQAGAVLMPSYVNIGAYVGEGTMVDT